MKIRYILAMLVSACVGFGAASPAAADMKIAVLNAERALLSCSKAERMLADLEQELAPDQDAIKALNADIAALQQRAQKDADVLTDAQKRNMANQMEDKRLEYRQRLEKVQKAIADRQEDIYSELAPVMDAVVKELIESEGYDMILPRPLVLRTQQGAVPLNNVLYVNDEHDITRKVTEKLNQRID